MATSIRWILSWNTRKLNALIDMEVGPDGNCISWNMEMVGSRRTKIRTVTHRLTIRETRFLENQIIHRRQNIWRTSRSRSRASVKATDPENKKLTYHWNFGNGVQKETSGAGDRLYLRKVGEFTSLLKYSTAKMRETKSNAAVIFAGNEMPSVSISLSTNQSFLFS